MKKSTNIPRILLLIPAIVIVLFFLWTNPDKRGIIEWTSLAFLSSGLILAGVFTREVGDENYPLTASELAIKYCICQTIAGFSFIILSQLFGWYDCEFRSFPCLLVLTSYLILAALFIVRISVHRSADKVTKDSIQQQKEYSEMRFQLYNSAALIIAMTPQEAEVTKALKNLADSIAVCGVSRFKDEDFVNQLSDGLNKLVELCQMKDFDQMKNLAESLQKKCI